MFLQAFQVTVLGFAQIFILGLIGYIIFKRRFLKEEGLNALSRLVLDITLPLMIFCRLSRDFSFRLYPDWWVFVLISIAITIAGFSVGLLFVGALRGLQDKLQFLSLISFQNSGYLPLALVASLLPAVKADELFIYIFLFLLGFNLLFFSLGVYLLTFSKDKKFAWRSLFNPPVIATILSLLLVWSGLNKSIPSFVIKPLEAAGDCTLPLAILVVGANIAAIRLNQANKKAMALLILAKLVILPLLGLGLVWKLKVPELMGLLIVMQLAMPPATNLSVLVSQYKKEDRLISQGIFYGHIISLVTIPLFLSLYFMINMIK
jgi:predicted permease